jgi:4-hydroxybenzoate polyprenyltransferase
MGQAISGAILNVKRKTVMYGRMIKFEHTIFALPFAFAALLLALRVSSVTWKQVIWICFAMVGARSAAMGFNRVADARIDAKNPRTSDRDLPSGRITVGEALAFVIASCLLFVLSSYMLSWTCFWSSFFVLIILLGYSYTKRFTWLCHLFLGIAIGLVPLAVWVAITNTISPRIAIFPLALCPYMAGFDILYACQDIEFDRSEGLYSLPAVIGPGKAMIVSALLHCITFGALFSLFRIFNLTYVYLAFVGVIGALLVAEHFLVRPRDISRIHMAFFQINCAISVLLFVAFLSEELLRRYA